MKAQLKINSLTNNICFFFSVILALLLITPSLSLTEGKMYKSYNMHVKSNNINNDNNIDIDDIDHNDMLIEKAEQDLYNNSENSEDTLFITDANKEIKIEKGYKNTYLTQMNQGDYLSGEFKEKIIVKPNQNQQMIFRKKWSS